MNMETDFLKLVSLNIEKDRHFDRILPFLKKERPDVILLQEVFSKDIPRFEETLQMNSAFAIMKILQVEGNQCPLGVATFSPLSLTAQSAYYRGTPETLPIVPEGNPTNTNQVILETTVLKNQKKYRLINTHFTWTPDGQDTPLQHQDLHGLLKLLSQLPDFILCGDFNAPRGRVIFDTIASQYKDNIPSHIITTIDKNLHRAGDLQLVVDGLFSTPQYRVESVKLFDGLSDHYAISAKIFL
jgi:endonuclease/exonuclease/phosphatase family metal-dependent hydrolase